MEPITVSEITLNWPSVIEFGPGCKKKLEVHLEGKKKVFFLVDLPLKDKMEPLVKKIEETGTKIRISYEVVPEPPFESLEKLIEPVKTFSPDTIVGVGGGSAIDLAKLVSVLFSEEQSAEEIIGIDNVAGRDVKLIAIPTTSGTGSEVTPIAVLTDLQQKLKKGAVSKHLVPDVAIVDPELTLSLPPEITASTGMDALTHCIEAYTNRFSHPIIDNVAIEGIRLISSNLESSVKYGSSLDARTSMSLGSLYGGLCLGPVNTAAVHAMAYPLGGEFKVPHGVSNAVLLPFIMNFNLPDCTQKYANIALACGVAAEGSPEALAKKGIFRIRELSENCGIPPGLKDLGIPESAIPSMAEAALEVKRLLNNNPRTINREEAEMIFKKAFHGILD